MPHPSLPAPPQLPAGSYPDIGFTQQRAREIRAQIDAEEPARPTTPHRVPPTDMWPFVGGTQAQQQAELAARATRWAAEADAARREREQATLAAQQRRKAQWPVDRIAQLMAEARGEL